MVHRVQLEIRVMENADFLSSIRALIQSEMVDVNTSLPGVVVSYANGLASVRPLANKRFQDGDVLAFPVIHNVPIRWPVFAGGLAGVKGPVVPGDKVLLVFSQQAKDGTDDQRRFDLSDAYAVICDNSQSGQGGNNTDMIMYFGAAYIKITAGGALEINAPAGTTTIAPSNLLTGSQLVQGNITGQSGFNISGGTGSTVNITGTITNNGVNIGSTHRHPITSGSSAPGPTGTPV